MTTSKDFVGPSAWKLLHSLAAAYSPEQRADFLAFVNSLAKMFPCKTCRTNLKKKLRLLPPHNYLDNNHDLFFWTYTIHDMVNKAITKYQPDAPKHSPPYEKVKYMYFSALGEHCAECNL